MFAFEIRNREKNEAKEKNGKRKVTPFVPCAVRCAFFLVAPRQCASHVSVRDAHGILYPHGYRFHETVCNKCLHFVEVPQRRVEEEAIMIQNAKLKNSLKKKRRKQIQATKKMTARCLGKGMNLRLQVAHRIENLWTGVACGRFLGRLALPRFCLSRSIGSASYFSGICSQDRQDGAELEPET